MKRNILIAIAFLLSLAVLKAEDKVWNARVTVEATDGTKTQSIAAFMPDDSARLPITLGTYGQCTTEIRPYPALMTTDDKTFSPNMIFSVLLPFVFGKDQQLLKCPEGTVTVRLSVSEEKEPTDH